MSRVIQRVEEWKRKIVDLSRRNRLLFFSRTRGSTLRILEPNLSEVFNRLVNLEKPWLFFMPPDEDDPQEPRGDSPAPLLFPEASPGPILQEEEEEIRSRPKQHHLGTDQLQTDIEEGTRLRGILRNLYRRSRTDFEERGVRILFLTFGVLKWREVEQSEVIKSPILLVPVELKRDSINDPFELCPVDEERPRFKSMRSRSSLNG